MLLYSLSMPALHPQPPPPPTGSPAWPCSVAVTIYIASTTRPRHARRLREKRDKFKRTFPFHTSVGVSVQVRACVRERACACVREGVTYQQQDATTWGTSIIYCEIKLKNCTGGRVKDVTEFPIAACHASLTISSIPNSELATSVLLQKSPWQDTWPGPSLYGLYYCRNDFLSFKVLKWHLHYESHMLFTCDFSWKKCDWLPPQTTAKNSTKTVIFSSNAHDMVLT